MDQAAGWFVAGLLVVATATALFWLQADSANWLPNTIAVLIVTCPCALALADARRLARRTRRNILQNLAWAAAYNLLAVPFAAAGWIPPWGAAIGMSFSLLLVVMNALRLQRR
jgi:Cu2+-exporting ATPase